MQFTLRQNGQQMATVNVAFHIDLNALVVAALHVVSFNDVTVDGLTKTAIEAELRSSLWSSGDQFVEYGPENATGEALAQRDAIEAKVAALYGLPR